MGQQLGGSSGEELDMRILKDTMFAFVKKKARCRKSGRKKRVANVYYERQEADIQTLWKKGQNQVLFSKGNPLV